MLHTKTLDVCHRIKKAASNDFISFLSRLLALYFFILFHISVGFPPDNTISSAALTFLAISAFLFLLPLAKRLNIAKFIEYEAKIEEVKNNITEFKEETRQILRMYNNLINAISNTVSQSVVVNLPGQAALQEAREELETVVEDKAATMSIEERIESYLAAEGDDLNYALAKLRMDIERQLRRILGKRLETDKPLSMKGEFLSARSLFRDFTKRYPKYESMQPSFEYMLQICNAAIHGQAVPRGYAHEALYMGLTILEELRSIMVSGALSGERGTRSSR